MVGGVSYPTNFYIMKLYLIPAYGETIRNQGYRRIITAAKNAGYDVIVLNLQLKGNLLSELVAEAIKVIQKTPDCTLFGFSTGALIAYKISTLVPIKKGLFCSISPILGADIPKNKLPYIKLFGEESLEELKKSEYGISLTKQSLFFYGDKEGRKLISRSRKLSELSHGNTVTIANNDHELNSDYVNEVIKFV